jgi:ankyrin repeat protein
MHLITKNQIKEAISLLDNPMININLQNEYRKSVLMYAIETDIPTIIMKILMHPKIILNNKDYDGMTPLMLLINNTMIQLLPDNDIKYYLAKKILEQGQNLTLKNNEGMTALMLAINMNHMKIAKKILQVESYNMNVKNLNTTNNSGYTALMLAVLMNMEPIVRILLSLGADKNIVNTSGKTALDFVENDEIREILEI